MISFSRFRILFPLRLRRNLKTGFAGAKDIVSPIKAPRVPARRHTLIGGGDFIEVGETVHRVLIRHGLRPDMIILEPGCGQGRIARPMIGWLDGGRYTGFDIDARMIDWCRKAYADLNDFAFHHIDVANPLYNRRGTIASSEAIFPAEDDSVDFLFMTSVFTHMQTEDIRHYLHEVARVLRPGARCVISWFVLRPEGSEDRMGFRHVLKGGSLTTVTQLSEAAIAHPHEFVEDAYRNAGLTVCTDIRGQWSGGPGAIGLQDLIIADLPR